jgi:uncharacterized membrane protein
MMHLLLAVSEKSPWKGLFGAFHPGIVHFPIALLALAAALELIQILRKRREPSPATTILTYFAAASAVPAALFGFILADYGGAEGRLIDLHQWFGVGATVVSLAAAAAAFKAKSSPGALTALRIGLILGAFLVGTTGYLGGELVFGEGHVLKHVREILGMVPPKAEPHTIPTSEIRKEPLLKPETTTVADKVDFAKDIAPVIKDMCFKCHGGEKVKGKFNLGTKKTAFDQAESGKAILPGKATLSKFYTSMTLAKDDDELMPPIKEKARPTPEQIEKVKKWIEQGADWPDAFEFKK